ncbi:MAG: YgaP family membrane protein [Anaerolineae bacterium]
MQANEGTVDRIVRLVLGAVLLWAGLWPLGGLRGAAWGIVAAVIGLILLFTAATGFCLIYRILGISTRK